MRLLKVFVMFLLTFLLSLCFNIKADAIAKWGVYIYMCGSDLEHDSGVGTADLLDILESKIPNNVHVVVQAGGSSKWSHPSMDVKKTQRFICRDHSLIPMYTGKLENMGSEEGFTNFLDWCVNHYPAKRSMVIMWSHGSGSIDGFGLDELFKGDSLSLTEMKNSFAKVGKKFDVVGFDACLMSTLETANVLSDYAKYMIASQEEEPLCGWSYSELFELLAKRRYIKTEKIGQTICESYYIECKRHKADKRATMSMVDLKKVPKLVAELEKWISPIPESTPLRRKVDKAARASVEFGDEMNLVDLGNMIKLSGIPADNLLDAYDNSVIYTVVGSKVKKATGLSIYYPLSNKQYKKDRKVYKQISASEAYSKLLDENSVY